MEFHLWKYNRNNVRKCKNKESLCTKFQKGLSVKTLKKYCIYIYRHDRWKVTKENTSIPYYNHTICGIYINKACYQQNSLKNYIWREKKNERNLSFSTYLNLGNIDHMLTATWMVYEELQIRDVYTPPPLYHTEASCLALGNYRYQSDNKIKQQVHSWTSCYVKGHM
jgi:hypothetical protein